MPIWMGNGYKFFKVLRQSWDLEYNTEEDAFTYYFKLWLGNNDAKAKEYVASIFVDGIEDNELTVESKFRYENSQGGMTDLLFG